jgi:hypothetical protein
MTETVSSKASAGGWNEPTKNLPPLEVRELPEPVPLGKLIGASVILLATPPDSSRHNVRGLRSALHLPGLLVRQRRIDGTTVAGMARISG